MSQLAFDFESYWQHTGLLSKGVSLVSLGRAWVRKSMIHWGTNHLGFTLRRFYFWGTLVSTALICVCGLEMGGIRGSEKGKEKSLGIFEHGKTVSNDDQPD